MSDDNTRGERDTPTVAHVYRLGDEIIFKYEGNVRATVEGSELIGGRAWVVARASIVFIVPPSQVVGVEHGEEGGLSAAAPTSRAPDSPRSRPGSAHAGGSSPSSISTQQLP
jgi:hypothetical protein